MLSSSLGMSSSSLNYGSGSGASGNAYINGAFRLMQFAGFVYVFIAFMDWYRKNAGDGHGITHGHLVTRLIAGTLMIHSKEAVILLASTIGYGSEVSSLIK
jgi:hypothetical protein